MINASEQKRRPGATYPDSTDGAGSKGEHLRLVTYFQPFYNLRSDGLQGLEALARRSDVGNGRPSLPAAFLAEDEAAEKVREIDLWILDDALSHLARWYETKGRTELILSVNLSRHTVCHPDVVTDVTDILGRHGMPGERLLVDITVDTLRRLTSEADDARAHLAALRELGTTVCLDHFCAPDVDLLEAASAVPVDIIKLDPRELRTLTEDELAGVAKAIQDLGLPAVASGVESQEQLDLARRLDFEWAQGFFLGEPVKAAHALRPPSWLS